MIKEKSFRHLISRPKTNGTSDEQRDFWESMGGYSPPSRSTRRMGGPQQLSQTIFVPHCPRARPEERVY